MFHKVLIANRGEIACRVIRTCRRLGISTVAIYSEADANALHVTQADEAYCVGPPPAKESYLDIEKILKIARDSGAEAIHPGYGFLSENPIFAQACADTGITFVGPSVNAITQMGDKVTARALARAAGVPILPGSYDEVRDEDALTVAQEIGFPVMVKASAGGGGIGMRVAWTNKELTEVLKQSRSLAQNAFGNGKVYLERLVEGAAHVEVQILADHYGHVLHLFERDCSVQRRHQKVIEETPSVRINSRLRDRMTTAAVSLAQHLNYTNAGTVEFIVDPNGKFYFLEINTRLQVEHPVTEMVTGLDLVELQLKIAAGEPLAISQKDVTASGHAIEARVYSEDPNTLLPTTGVIRELEEPQGLHVRVDGGIAVGYEVSPHYDPLLAKLAVWGKTRKDAIDKLDKALLGFRIRGIRTNIPLVRSIANHSNFHRGNYDTGLVDLVLKERVSSSAQTHKLVAAISIALSIALRRKQSLNNALGPTPNAWKIEGRRRQMLSRIISRGGRW